MTLGGLLNSLKPTLAPVSAKERLRAAAGALIGIAVTGLSCRLIAGPDVAGPLLVAPMGASAVLLFAAPASPLAQPWSILGGNIVSGLIGVTAAMLISDPLIAAPVAVAAAIGAMLALRCVHPPSGAVALTAVLGGPAVTALGYGFVLWPVLANTLVLLLAAVAYNTATGKAYPHRPKTAPAPNAAQAPAPEKRFGFSSSDLDAALADYDQLLDVDRRDLDKILRQAEIQGFRRRAGEVRCGDVMTRNVVAVSPEAPLLEALGVIRAHHVKALPVTDERAHVIGMVTQTDLLDKAAWGEAGPKLGAARRFGLSLRRGRAASATVAEIMSTPARAARPDMLIADLVPLMTREGLHHLPVVDGNDQLVGIVTQADMIAALIARDGDAPGSRAA